MGPRICVPAVQRNSFECEILALEQALDRLPTLCVQECTQLQDYLGQSAAHEIDACSACRSSGQSALDTLSGPSTKTRTGIHRAGASTPIAEQSRQESCVGNDLDQTAKHASALAPTYGAPYSRCLDSSDMLTSVDSRHKAHQTCLWGIGGDESTREHQIDR
jgi:hypothetical protein